jgi:protein O-mannosyl-transferase
MPRVALKSPAQQAAFAQWAAALAGLLVATGALGNGFPNDDQWIVAEALDFRHPSQWGHALARPWWPYANALWRPVTTLQLAAETWLGGGAEWPYHAVNCLWHALASALVVRLALRALPPMAAGVAGIAFAWHPIHVEPVATLVGRADMGVTVFLLALALAASRDGPITRARGWELFAWSALALGSKESGIAAPAIAWAIARARRPHGEALGVAAWSAAGLIPLLIGRWLVLGTLGGDEPHPTWVGMAWAPATALALRTLAVGVGYLLWPATPKFEHAPPQSLIDAPEPWLIATGALLCGGVLAAFVTHVRKPGTWPIPALWWGATILPVSNLVFRSGIVLADRTLYGPSVAACLLLGSLWALQGPVTRHALRVTRYALLTAWLLTGLYITRRDLPLWKDSQSFIETIIRRAPDSWPGYLFRGMARVGSGDRVGAKADFDAGIRVFPREGRLLHERARLALADGDTAMAVALLERSVAAYPKALRPRQVLLDTYAREGQPARRCTLLAKGVALAPDQRRWATELAAMRQQGGCR